MNLFAYGTLMSPEGSHAALGDRASALRYWVASLRGWRRIWNAYRQEWGGGVLNVEPDADSEVVGVVIEGLALDDFALLVLLRARDAGPAVLANLASGSVDPWGRPLRLGGSRGLP